MEDEKSAVSRIIGIAERIETLYSVSYDEALKRVFYFLGNSRIIGDLARRRSGWDGLRGNRFFEALRTYQLDNEGTIHKFNPKLGADGALDLAQDRMAREVAENYK